MSKLKEYFYAAKENTHDLFSLPSADRLRMTRWLLAKLSEVGNFPRQLTSISSLNTLSNSKGTARAASGSEKDIRTSIQSSAPTNDIQLATTIAYYYAS